MISATCSSNLKFNNELFQLLVTAADINYTRNESCWVGKKQWAQGLGTRNPLVNSFSCILHTPIICDWIYGNRSKSHIGSYEIINFKDFKAL